MRGITALGLGGVTRANQRRMQSVADDDHVETVMFALLVLLLQHRRTKTRQKDGDLSMNNWIKSEWKTLDKARAWRASRPLQFRLTYSMLAPCFTAAIASYLHVGA